MQQSSLQKINDGASSSRSASRVLAHIPSFLQKQKRFSKTSTTNRVSTTLQKDIDIEWSIATGQILSVRGGDSSTSDSDDEDEMMKKFGNLTEHLMKQESQTTTTVDEVPDDIPDDVPDNTVNVD